MKFYTFAVCTTRRYAVHGHRNLRIITKWSLSRDARVIIHIDLSGILVLCIVRTLNRALSHYTKASVKNTFKPVYLPVVACSRNKLRHDDFCDVIFKGRET